jgi:PAS domain S-box-containing protein
LTTTPPRPAAQPDPDRQPLGADLAWALVDYAPDGIVVVDDGGVIVLANRRLEAMFGYGPAALVGQSVEVLVPRTRRDAHARHRGGYARQPHTRAMGATLELSGVRADGSEFPVEVSLAPVATQAGALTLAMVRDVSEKAAAAARLLELQRLVDTGREMVLLCRPHSLEITYANLGAALLTGRDPAWLLGRRAEELCPAVGTAETVADLHRLVAGELDVVETEVDVRRADGSTVPALVLLQRFDAAGEPRLAAFVRDLTDQRRAHAERERAERIVALIEEQERIARDLHDTVGQSLFGIGMALQSVAQLSPEGRLRDRMLQTIEDLDQAIRSLRTTVFALSAPGPLGGGLRDQVLSTAQEASRSLGFLPGVRTPGPVDLTIPDGVTRQLVPSLREMLTNIARHARASEATIDVSVDDGEVVLAVRDNGVGTDTLPRPLGGLRNLADRADSLGGSFAIARRPEGGSLAVWRVPLPSGESRST